MKIELVRKNVCLHTFFLLITLLGTKGTMAQNPIVQTVYTADPAPLVKDDTLYLFTSKDEDASTWFTMKEWRLYATADMVNWTDKGSSLSLQDFTWADKDAWAGQCVYRNGKYFFYICAHQKQTGRMAIGVAVSDRPEGPYKDPLGKPLAAFSGGDIDPTVWIDANGEAWLFWGNPDLWMAKLNKDMISLDSSFVVQKYPFTQESFGLRTGDPKRTSQYEEGPWLFRRKDLYYSLFAAGGVPEHLAYATASKPTGPWQYRDTIMPIIRSGGAFTNHPGYAQFKGRDFFFYHNGALPGGGGFNRSVAVEEFSFLPDGRIPRIAPTGRGIVAPVKRINPFSLHSAVTIAWSEGIETKRDEKHGMVVGNLLSKGYLKVRSVNFSEKARKIRLLVKTTADDAVVHLQLQHPSDSPITSLKIPHTNGEWQWIEAPVDIKGEVDLFFLVEPGERAKLEWSKWQFFAQPKP